MKLPIALCLLLAGFAVFASYANEASAASSSPPSAIRAQRLDPYKNFRFRLKWDGRTVAAVNRIGGLVAPAADVVEHRAGGDPSTSHKSPGRNKFEAITLERGLTQDLEFQQWASKIGNHAPHDLILEAYAENGRLSEAYRIHRCWVSEYQALPQLDAGDNAVAIEHIKLENEGWERMQ